MESSFINKQDEYMSISWINMENEKLVYSWINNLKTTSLLEKKYPERIYNLQKLGREVAKLYHSINKK